MARERKVGNKRLYNLTNHRLDKDGVNRQISDPQETAVTLMAGEFGAGQGPGGTVSGVMGPISVSLDGATIDFDEPFTLGHATLDENMLPAGFVVLYDPSSPAQATTTLPLAAFEGEVVFLIFRQMFASTDTLNQAYYDGGPQTDTTATRERAYVEFAAVLADEGLVGDYSAFYGWALFGAVRNWVGPTPVLEFVDVVDSYGYSTTFENRATSVTPLTSFPLTMGGQRGWPRWVKTLVNQLYMQHDSLWEIGADGVPAYQGVDPGVGWYRKVPYGNLQVQHFINEVWTTEPRVLWQGRLAWSGSDVALASQMSLFGIVATVTEGVWGTLGTAQKAVITIAGDKLPTGTVVHAVTAVAGLQFDATYPLAADGDGSAGVLYAAKWAVQQSLPFSGNGSNPLVIDVGVAVSANEDARIRVPANSPSIVTVYGTYASRSEDYVFISRD